VFDLTDAFAAHGETCEECGVCVEPDRLAIGPDGVCQGSYLSQSKSGSE
jgi:hypothetical protein